MFHLDISDCFQDFRDEKPQFEQCLNSTMKSVFSKTASDAG